MQKISTLLLALIACAGTIFADKVKIGNLYYNLNADNKTAMVTSKPSGNYTGDIIIPASVDYNSVTYSVTTIGTQAFYYCTSLTSIEIPNRVTSIGNYAFAYCSGLTSIEIPNSVTSIEAGAFNGCTGLTSIEIPNSVTSIGSSAFYGCTGLTSITIPNSVTSIGFVAFAGCTGLTSITCHALTPPTCGNDVFDKEDKSIPLYVPEESIDLYKAAEVWKDFTNILPIPGTETECLIASGTCGDNLSWKLSCDSVLTILGSGDMYSWSKITSVPWYEYTNAIRSVSLPEGITSIGMRAFEGCALITSITIPDGVTSIGGRAFNSCEQLASINIPNSVVEFGGENGTALYNTAIWNDYANWVDGVLYYEGWLVKAERDMGFSASTYEVRDGTRGIGGSAFKDNRNLTSITIPNSVTSIGSSAFSGCTGLTSVTNYATTPQTISSYVFYKVDKSLCTLYVPAESIDLYKAADQWKDFTNILPIEETPGTCLIASGTCGENLTWELSCDSVLIISGTGAMADYSYQDIPWSKHYDVIKQIIVSDGVTTIGTSAFIGCTSAETITLGKDITYIGEGAMYIQLGKLTTITCNAATPPTLGGDKTLSGYDNIYVPCPSLEAYKTADFWARHANFIHAIEGTCNPEPCLIASGTCGDNLTWELSCEGVLTIEGSGTMSDFVREGSPWYPYVDNIKSVTLSNSVTSIGNSAFYKCSALTSIEIPNSVTSIGERAFESCSGLTSIEIPNSVTSIGNAAFWGCYGLTSIEIPNSVTIIGNWAFFNCGALTSITIPNSVTSIGTQAFAYCTGLTSITIPNSVTSIANYAFDYCTGLTSMVVASGNTTYDSRDNCNAIIETSSNTLIAGCQNSIIPNSVTSIGSGAFSNCTGLTSIEIPNSVTSIGDYTFDGCTGLTSITCHALTPPTCGNDVFDKVDKSIPLYVPEESIDLYKAAEVWKDFTNIQAIPGEPEPITDYTINYLDKDGGLISTQIVKLELPEPSVIAGFTFVKWIATSDNIIDGINIQAVYEYNGDASAPEIYTNPANPAQKLIRNGNVYILTGDKTYTVTGQQLK